MKKEKMVLRFKKKLEELYQLTNSIAFDSIYDDDKSMWQSILWNLINIDTTIILIDSKTNSLPELRKRLGVQKK